MKVIWTESNRVTELEFDSMQDFGDWVKEQYFYPDEVLEIVG